MRIISKGLMVLINHINNEFDDFIKNNNFSQWIKDYSDQYCNSCFAQKTCQGNSCPLENIRQNQKICPPLKVDINSLTNQVVKFYEKKITNSKIK